MLVRHRDNQSVKLRARQPPIPLLLYLSAQLDVLEVRIHEAKRVLVETVVVRECAVSGAQKHDDKRVQHEELASLGPGWPQVETLVRAKPPFDTDEQKLVWEEGQADHRGHR